MRYEIHLAGYGYTVGHVVTEGPCREWHSRVYWHEVARTTSREAAEAAKRLMETT